MALHLLLADPHATRRPPSSCTERYWEDVRSLLWQSVELARALQAASVIWAGDVFHHKAPSRTDHGLMGELIDIVQAYPCPAWAVGGNHDMQHDRLESVDATQPLGVLFRAGLRRLDGWMYGPDGQPAAPVYGVSWQQRWSEDRISECLAPYRATTVVACRTAKPLVVAHAPIYPPGKEPGYEGAEFTPARWWSAAMAGTGCLFYGHIHEPHGWWEDGGTEFCNYGALSRGSIDEFNLDRAVGCTTWDDQTGEFRFRPLQAVPAADLFRLEERGQAVTSQAKLAEFLEHVGQVRLPVLTVEGVMAEIRRRGLPARVVEVAEELLTAAAHERRR